MMVLIAEDDRVYSLALMRQLKSRSVDSTVAYDAMQAIMAASRLAPAAILLDLNIPGGTGLEVLKRLKNSSKTCMIPVIIMSAAPDPNLPFTVKNLGADDFFAKPIHFEKLYARLCQLTEQEAPPPASAPPRIGEKFPR